MPSIVAEKAPIVQFDFMEYGTDAEASERAGRPVPKVLPFAFIQPDKFTRLEYPAEEWLAKKKREAIEGRCNPDWVTRWEMQYQAWKKGEELPLEGQPIKTWAALNKEQVSRLIAMGYMTIEQLASVTDTNLAIIGLDGRYLRDLARKAMDQHQNGGAMTIEVASLKQSLRDKDEQIQRMQERLAALEQQNEGGEVKRGPGRPKGS
jgi:hypothetical protein